MLPEALARTGLRIASIYDRRPEKYRALWLEMRCSTKAVLWNRSIDP